MYVSLKKILTPPLLCRSKLVYTMISSFKFLIIFLSLLILLPLFVNGECTCNVKEDRNKIEQLCKVLACHDEEGDQNKTKALRYKLIALSSILFASAIGVCIPVLGKTIPALSPEKNIFFVIKAFAAGVILSTGFIHVLPDAFESLTSSCLKDNPWTNFPFTGFVAMMSAIVTLMVDTMATNYHKRSHFENWEHGDHLHVHTNATHVHAHGSAFVLDDSNLSSNDLIRHRVISQVLELGIVVHSVIIGIALGASESPKTIKPLVAALTFHQFFEGMGLGGCITQAKFKCRAVTIMALFFALTTPVGIAIGIIVTKYYDENSPTALIVQGILNSASAGILIYMALVDLLAADFMSPRVQSNGSLQFMAYIALLIGAGCMSLLAKWA